MGTRGRRKSPSPKEREAIYLDPRLREWVLQKSEECEQTVSQYICSVLEKERRNEQVRRRVKSKTEAVPTEE